MFIILLKTSLVFLFNAPLSQAVFVSSEEAGKDLEHVEALKKKFEGFQAELASNEAKLTSITTMAEGMVQEGHTDAEEIQGELEVIIIIIIINNSVT